MKNETHNIETIEQLFEVATEENFERIMTDFLMFAEYCVKSKKEIPDLIIKGFVWTDDGVNELTGVILNGEQL